MVEEKLSDRVAQDVKRYVDLRADDAKLAVVEGLSSAVGGAIALIVGLFVLNLALVLFTGVLVYLINMLVDSWLWSGLIMGVLYTIVGIWVMLRPGCFRDRMVRVFAPMFFCHQKYEEDDDE